MQNSVGCHVPCAAVGALELDLVIPIAQVLQENPPRCWRSGVPWLNLAPCKENRLLIHHLRPQNVAEGRCCIDFQHRSSSHFLISHPLLCNWFSRNLPGMEEAGYHFDFAFLPSHECKWVMQKCFHDCLTWDVHWVCEHWTIGKFCASDWKSELIPKILTDQVPQERCNFGLEMLNAVLFLWVHFKVWFCHWAVLQLFKTCFFLKPVWC